MKITIYELLGMIKDGKAPKNIKYKNDIYEYEDYDYFGENRGYFFDRYSVSGMLNEEIEILEEQKKIPEKLEIYKSDDGTITGLRESINIMFDDTASKINSIIDYLKSKGE